MKIRIAITLFLLLAPFELAANAATSDDCPPKDTYICKLADGPEKGKEIIALEHRQKRALKNGAAYGVIAKKTPETSIDDVKLEDSGFIYEAEGSSHRKTFRFAMTNSYDASTDIKKLLKTTKRGTLTVMPFSGQGTYQFDGAPNAFAVCQAKYFEQVNPHQEKPRTDAEICETAKEQADRAAAAGARTEAESKAFAPSSSANKKKTKTAP